VLTQGELVLSRNVTIESGGGPQATISGDNLSRVFFVGSGTDVILNDLDVTGGNGQVAGASPWLPGPGGISNQWTLWLFNSSVSGNSAIGKGGGLYNAGYAWVVNSTFSCNYVTGSYSYGLGGAIFNRGTMDVQNSQLIGNDAGLPGRGSEGTAAASTTTAR
jgi:hypothetical protein